MTIDLNYEKMTRLHWRHFHRRHETVRFTCVERAEGNPLFLEQLLRNAEERGDREVPASIQSLVLARMDHLSPADKNALQSASVLGQRFSLDALRHLIENSQYTCGGLIERHLVRPEGDDYLFAHALVREGVYTSPWTARRENRTGCCRLAASGTLCYARNT
jgi:hypothetical protein